VARARNSPTTAIVALSVVSSLVLRQCHEREKTTVCGRFPEARHRDARLFLKSVALAASGREPRLNAEFPVGIGAGIVMRAMMYTRTRAIAGPAVVLVEASGPSVGRVWQEGYCFPHLS